MVGKLMVGGAAVGAGGAALAGCFLFGYALGIEYALNSAANLRHVAECVGEGDEGCEWVYNSTMRELGKPEGPLQYADRYIRPFEGVPVLGRLTYDLATNKMEPVRVYP